MPNMNSKAGHIPIRTCVVCREKSEQSQLLSFVLLPGGIVYDLLSRLPARKQYVCRSRACVSGLAKWRKKRQKGKRT